MVIGGWHENSHDAARPQAYKMKMPEAFSNITATAVFTRGDETEESDVFFGEFSNPCLNHYHWSVGQ